MWKELMQFSVQFNKHLSQEWGELKEDPVKVLAAALITKVSQWRSGLVLSCLCLRIL